MLLKKQSQPQPLIPILRTSRSWPGSLGPVRTGYSSGHARKNVLADDFMQEVEEEEVGLSVYTTIHPIQYDTIHKLDVRIPLKGWGFLPMAHFSQDVARLIASKMDGHPIPLRSLRSGWWDHANNCSGRVATLGNSSWDGQFSEGKLNSIVTVHHLVNAIWLGGTRIIPKIAAQCAVPQGQDLRGKARFLLVWYPVAESFGAFGREKRRISLPRQLQSLEFSTVGLVSQSFMPVAAVWQRKNRVTSNDEPVANLDVVLRKNEEWENYDINIPLYSYHIPIHPLIGEVSFYQWSLFWVCCSL